MGTELTKEEIEKIRAEVTPHDESHHNANWMVSPEFVHPDRLAARALVAHADAMAEKVARLEQINRNLGVAVYYLEWDNPHSGGARFCQVCHGSSLIGHAEDCIVRRALTPLPPKEAAHVAQNTPGGGT